MTQRKDLGREMIIKKNPKEEEVPRAKACQRSSQRRKLECVEACCESCRWFAVDPMAELSADNGELTEKFWQANRLGFAFTGDHLGMFL